MNSRTTRSFWKLFDALPPEVQRRAVNAYDLWRRDPAHPSLQFKRLSGGAEAYSIRVGLHWRSLGYRDGNTVTWFWIGSHGDYDRLIGGM